MTIYDSRDLDCKRPFGAIKTGERAAFTIRLPKMNYIDEPVMKICPVDQLDSPIIVPMRFCRSDLVSNSFTCTFSAEKPGVFLYTFEMFSAGQLLCIKRSDNGAGVISNQGHAWQLTIYDRHMKAPDFMREGLMYQIFPDRFYYSGKEHENVPQGRLLRDDWGGMPVWRPNEQGEVTNSDYFKGDLAGITEKLDYLESLGVSCIYLNPIFEAHSNHRYNTADYRKIDPLLGTNADFANLCTRAKAKGIAIILDGVFSHTGSDSVYFNKEGRYGSGGAYNDPESPYRDWYSFSDYPAVYDSWWGFVTLPNVNETSPSYMDYICGENGVLRYWLGLGAAGFRLDVADELPDEFLDALHDCVKGYSDQAVVIGEVWEDASNKEAYGVRRRYLLGGQLDGVMNYPFKDAVLGYVRYGNGDIFYAMVMQILENYPKPAIQCLMNFLSTHDVERAITALAGQTLDHTTGRDWQEARNQLDPEACERGKKLFKLASILQFGLPGMPCVYYGDEAGVCGYRDPFNRACYPWGKADAEIVSFISQLGNMRRDYPIFGDADFVPIIFSHSLCCFARTLGDETMLFAINRSQETMPLRLPEQYQDAEYIVTCGNCRHGELGPLSGAVLRDSSRRYLRV